MRKLIVSLSGTCRGYVRCLRKQQQDAQPLIAEVAAVSEQLKVADTCVNDVVDEILCLHAQALGADNEPESKRLLGDWPAYFEVPGNSPEVSNEAVSIDPQPTEQEWRAYVEQQPRATCYHDIRWRKLIQTTFGHDTHYLAAKNELGNVCGVLPLVHLSSRLFGSFLVSMPYLNYGGPLSDSESIDNALMQHAANLANELGCSHMEIRETHERSGWAVKSHKVAMSRALPSTLEELEQQLNSKVRSQARRASREGATAFIGGAELVEDFYKVFSRNMRDLGTPVYNRAFFHQLVDTFDAESFLAVVRYRNAPVAAALLISHGQTLEIPWASSLREANRLSVNMLLYKSVLDEAVRRGYAHFDFGRSTEGAPTYRFKKQWGASSHPLHWHYWLPAGAELPNLNPSNAKYRLVIKAWQHTPVWVTNWVGPQLAKNLP